LPNSKARSSRPVAGCHDHTPAQSGGIRSLDGGEGGTLRLILPRTQFTGTFARVATPLVRTPVQWRPDLQGASPGLSPARGFSWRRLTRASMRRCRRCHPAIAGRRPRRRPAARADAVTVPAPSAPPSAPACRCGRRHRRRPVPCVPAWAAAAPPPVLACSLASLLTC
jgi:hypothetical protein